MISHHPKSVRPRRLELVPEPLRAVGPYAVIAALTAALGAAGFIGFRVWSALFAAAIVAGTGAGLWAQARRRQRFRAADAWIAHGRGSRPAEDVLRERSAILVDPHHRRMLAQSLRRTVADATGEHRGRSARVPLDRVVVRACAPDLLGVADVLGDRLRAVTPRAVVLAEELITDPGSPIYR